MSETEQLVKKLRAGVIGIEDSMDGWLVDGPATEQLIFTAADLLTSQASEIARLREALEEATDWVNECYVAYSPTPHHIESGASLRWNRLRTALSERKTT